MRNRKNPTPSKAGGNDVSLWTVSHYSFGKMLSVASIFAIAIVAMPSRLGRSGTAAKDCAVQVRLHAEQREWLQLLEDHTRGLGLNGFTRSEVIRDAVTAYLAPLIELLEREGSLAKSNDDWHSPHHDSDTEFGESMRIRLDHDLVKHLDRVEAYARGLGHRQTTRSSLIRNAVKAYRAGFKREMSCDLPSGAQSDSIAESRLERRGSIHGALTPPMEGNCPNRQGTASRKEV